jgi:catechol 2,3-dioxygenase-like lactoylglutathione lyase family enzyme
VRVTGFNHAALNVHAGLEETIEFYTGTLGLAMRERTPMAARVKGAWFQVGEHAQIHVADEVWTGTPRSPIGPHLSLWVDDIVAARHELEAKVIELFVIGDGESQVIWFCDPTGNTLELQQDPTNRERTSS